MLSTPRWILVKNLPPFLWHFLPHPLEPLGKVVQMDETTRLVPHMNVRDLVSLKPSMETVVALEINILEEMFSYPLELLSGLNACFLCKAEGHMQKDFPILKKKNLAQSSSGSLDLNPPDASPS